MAKNEEAQEVPDQQEDPEAYVQHVQDVREQDAELQAQIDGIAAQRSGLPQETDEEREAREKEIQKAQEKQAKEAEKAEA